MIELLTGLELVRREPSAHPHGLELVVDRDQGLLEQADLAAQRRVGRPYGITRPLSRRKSAIVLKSGASRRVREFEVALALALQAPAGRFK